MRGLLQFTLDLFDFEPAVKPVVTPAPVVPSVFKKRQKSKKQELNQAVALVEYAQLATELVVSGETLPAQTLTEVLLPANFRHPRANRDARLADALVAYEFKRGKRRTIGFSVGPDGLVVSAPK